MEIKFNKITIKKLFGKDNYVIPFEENRIMIISENGAGKTTILNLIYLFLAGKWEKLVTFHFETISLEYNENQKIEYTREILNPVEILSKNHDFIRGISYIEEIKYLFLNYSIDKLLERINQNEHFGTIRTVLEQKNRQEKSEESESEDDMAMLDSILSYVSEYIPHIISLIWKTHYIEKYEELNRLPKVLYLPTYRKIEVSETLLYATYGKKKNRHTDRDIHLFEFGMEDIENKISEYQNRSERIDELISVCNSYLYEKEIIRFENKLYIQFEESEEKYPLDRLSSGEKQLLTVFGYVYLSELSYILIYDEPEISFSIDWQRRLLPDLLKSNNVALLLTATHSPFLSDNQEMDSYVVSLNELYEGE